MILFSHWLAVILLVFLSISVLIILKGQYTLSKQAETIRHLEELLKKQTEQLKEAQETAKTSREELRRYFEQPLVGIIATDATKHTLQLNQRFCDMVGYSKAEMKHIDWSQITHPDDLAENLVYFEQASRGEIDSYQMEKRYFHKDGHLVYVHLAASCIRNEQGKAENFIGMMLDITERKRAAAELLKAKEFSRAIIDGLFAQLCVVNEQGVILTVNRAWHEFAQANSPIPANYAEGTNYFDICERAQKEAQKEEDAREAKEFAAGLRAVLQGSQEHFILEYPCHSPTEERWFIVYISRFSSGGKVLAVVVHENITERKKAEQALSKSEERYRSLITAMAEGLVMQNTQGEIIACNAAAERILGLTEAQMMGLTSLDPRWRAIHEDGSPFPGETHPIMVCLRTSEPQHNVTMGIHKPNGDLTWILINAEPLFQAGATTLYAAVTTFTDITENRNARLQIEAQRRTLQAVLDNIPAGIQVFAPDSTVLLSNRQAVSLLGRSAADKTPIADLNRNYGAFIYGTDALYPLEKMPVVRGLAGETSSVEDMELRHPDGSRVLLQVIGAPIRGETGKITASVVIFQDITARKQAENELIQARRAAEAANQAKSAFIANMSHELRTPLNAVLGFAQILGKDETLTEVQLSQVESIRHGGEYLLTLINDILDLAKIEAGRFELYFEIWHTDSFFRELVHIFRIRADQKGLFFRYEPIGALPYMLHGDDKRLRQILVNLLGNAVKFTERGSVTLRSNFSDGKLRIEVEDSGVGIAPSEIEKIFEPFQQSGANRYKVQGTGLGLAITRRLVAAMNGTLGIESTPGKGSLFWVEIPIEPVSTLSEAQTRGDQRPAVIGYQRTQGSGDLRVLVADDVADNRQVLRGLLEPLGFAVAEAENGLRCVEVAEIWLPDVILMDLRMPELDGLEATRRLRTLPQLQTTPVIVVSASTFTDDHASSQAAGCNTHISKPVQLEELLTSFSRLLPLTWNYADTSTVPQTENNIPDIETLSAKHAAHFIHLAKHGDIMGIEEFARHLDSKACCPEFSKQVRGLAKDFDIEALLALAKRYEVE